MNLSIQMLFMLFITYSVIGWLVETVFVFVGTKSLQNRGFLIGPYIPIYGIGCVLIVVLLSKYLDSPLVLFCMAIVICTLLEYFTSFIMEKLFHTRWWDYSNNKFNINGRVCLETMLPFGIASLFIMYFINPYIMERLTIIPDKTLNILCIIISVIFITDFIISFATVLGYSKTITNVKSVGYDATKDINEYIKDLLLKKSYLSKRLVKAFPNAKARIKLKEKFDKLIDDLV